VSLSETKAALTDNIAIEEYGESGVSTQTLEETQRLNASSGSIPMEVKKPGEIFKPHYDII
jgi:hypothetical protein